MKKYLLASVAALLSIIFILQNYAIADDPAARKIMVKVDARNDGDNMKSNMEMILIDKNKKMRERKIRVYRKDSGRDTLRIIFFLHPSNIKDTGFLTYDYYDSGKDDDQWLYLPALRKTKRIASSDKSGSFMGSDFTYSDMTSNNIKDYNYKLLKEIDVRGNKAWVIQAVPRTQKLIDETGYKKSLLIVRQDNYFVIRAIHYEKYGGYIKYMDVKKIINISGIWSSLETHMTRKKGKSTVHKTILRFKNLKYNQNLKKSMFTVRQLEKGY